MSYYLNDPDKLSVAIRTAIENAVFGEKYKLPMPFVEEIAEEVAEEHFEKCDELKVGSLSDKIRLFGVTLYLIVGSFESHGLDDYVTAFFIQKSISHFCHLEMDEIAERKIQSDLERLTEDSHT